MIRARPSEKEAPQDPLDVHIRERDPPAEGERRDGAGGVRADPGQGIELGDGVGYSALAPARDQMEVARAAVVAEARPFAEHRSKGGGGERGQRGEAPHEPLERRCDARRLRLLEHDLGYQHRVRIAGAAPRQIPRRGPVVGQETGTDRV